jgi:hypothetical protein
MTIIEDPTDREQLVPYMQLDYMHGRTKRPSFKSHRFTNVVRRKLLRKLLDMFTVDRSTSCRSGRNVPQCSDSYGTALAPHGVHSWHLFMNSHQYVELDKCNLRRINTGIILLSPRLPGDTSNPQEVDLSWHCPGSTWCVRGVCIIAPARGAR